MTAMYPHRKLWEELSIEPGAHTGAKTGEWVDYRLWAASAATFRIDVGALAGSIDFEFETCEADAAGAPDTDTIVQMGNCDICSSAIDFADGTVTINPAAEPFLSDGKLTAWITLCCPKRFVRAKTSNQNGSYSVAVTGLAKNLARA